MPKLTETFVSKLPLAKEGRVKLWDPEIRGLAIFFGKASKTWYFQKDMGGRTRRVMIGRYLAISASAARETALEFMPEWGRGPARRSRSVLQP
ncbi:Arm DNA-binding domain-containing protein [Tabrizicola sp.]|uniref:Arm DNA-binding domain-containing protein n=1 Tax=Tabrizicola sp. TaxID=2005166 RepID=UPI002FDD93B3